MNASEITTIVKATDSQIMNPGETIDHLLTDSRKLNSPQGTLFFAIPTKRNTGCRYIQTLYQKGVRNFVIPADEQVPFPDVNYWKVENVVLALQRIAAEIGRAHV